MALDLSLISAQDIIRKRHAHQQDVIRMFSAPLSQLNARELEEARLMLLDSLYAEEPEMPTSGISYDHYHLPILMCSAAVTTAQPLVEAWVRSALYMSYNLVLLVPESTDTAALKPLIDAHPEAASHLCLRSLERVETQQLAEAIAAYLPVQEPHLYLALEAEDKQLLDAMACGFLGLSLHERKGFLDGKNGFLLEGAVPRTLAYQMIEILEDPESDWEMLQKVAENGQTYARQELRS